MPDKAVFVIDDDAAVRHGLRFMLRAAGYVVEAFPSARSFLEDYDPRRGGCLLLDVRMPQMTGLELQQQLNVRGWRIPVIFITAYPERLLTGERPEPTYLITKPFLSSTVKATVGQALFFHPVKRRAA